MAKPSIFSRDYEQRMKRRRKTIIFAICIAIIVVAVMFFKFKIKDMDFTNIKAKIQAWVDTGKTKVEDEEIVEEDIEEIEELEEPQEVQPKEEYVELIISDGVVAKAKYMEENGVKKFVEVENIPESIYNINSLGSEVLILDKNQDMKVYNLDGKMTDITKKEYVSGKGDVFAKETVLTSNPEYIWHSQAKFIDDKNIIYVSQLPYFGTAATNKYIWIKNIETGEDKVVWNPKGTDTTIGDVNPEKGISVIINGVNYFVNANGEVLQ